MDKPHVPHSSGTNDTRHVTHSAGTKYARYNTLSGFFHMFLHISSKFPVLPCFKFYTFHHLSASLRPLLKSKTLVILSSHVPQFFYCWQILVAVTRHMSLLDFGRCVTFCNIYSDLQ